MLDYSKVEDAILYVCKKFADVESTKPTLLHSIRCGMELLNNGYGTDIVIAGILHDSIEDTNATSEDIERLFNEEIARIVAANTKDPTIEDKNKRREELIKRCCNSGLEATIVKVSDIYDNYLYYKATNNIELVNYCLELKDYVQKYSKPDAIKTDFIRLTLDKIR